MTPSNRRSFWKLNYQRARIQLVAQSPDLGPSLCPHSTPRLTARDAANIYIIGGRRQRRRCEDWSHLLVPQFPTDHASPAARLLETLFFASTPLVLEQLCKGERYINSAMFRTGRLPDISVGTEFHHFDSETNIKSSMQASASSGQLAPIIMPDASKDVGLFQWHLLGGVGGLPMITELWGHISWQYLQTCRKSQTFRLNARFRANPIEAYSSRGTSVVAWASQPIRLLVPGGVVWPWWYLKGPANSGLRSGDILQTGDCRPRFQNDVPVLIGAYGMENTITTIRLMQGAPTTPAICQVPAAVYIDVIKRRAGKSSLVGNPEYVAEQTREVRMALGDWQHSGFTSHRFSGTSAIRRDAMECKQDPGPSLTSKGRLVRERSRDEGKMHHHQSLPRLTARILFEDRGRRDVR
ncbi:hypothetical protein ACRALDRAFT_213012 [Sodiomyces alcalophilus JCM 7366]|uniref:uncharacterized protein n=1 Tax=Sodiomyces alcalophilus JCM 7366 TaxID=591952 RepID=UPI0039B66FDF